MAGWPVLLGAGLAGLVATLALPARADAPPDPDNPPPPCTFPPDVGARECVDFQRRAFGDKCEPYLETQGFVRHCTGWGASSYSVITCRARRKTEIGPLPGPARRVFL